MAQFQEDMSFPAQTQEPALQFDDQPQQQPALSLQLPSIAPPPVASDPTGLRILAAKYHIALGEKSPGVENIANSISTGHEDELRQQAAVEEANKVRDAGVNYVMNLSKNPVNPEAVKHAQAILKSNPQYDPTSIFENLYGVKYLQKAMMLSPEKLASLNKSLAEAPDATDYLLEAGRDKIARQQGLEKLAFNISQMAEQQSTMGAVADVAKQFFPGYSFVKKYNLIQNNKFFPGQDADSQYNRFWYDGSSEQAIGEATTAAMKLAQDNPRLALQWVMGLMSRKDTDAATDNIWSAAEAAMLGQLGSSGIKLTAGMLPVFGMVRSAVRSSGSNRLVTMANELGESEAAAKLNLIEFLKSPSENFPKLLADILNPTGDPTAGGSAIISARLWTAIKRQAGILFEDIMKPGWMPERITAEELEKMVANFGKEDVATSYGFHQDSISNLSREFNPQTNTWHYVAELRPPSPGFIGQYGRDKAMIWAENQMGLPPGGYRLKQLGDSWVIEVTSPMNIQRLVDWEITTARADPGATINLGSANRSLSDLSMQNRQTVDHVAHAIKERVARVMGDAIHPLNKSEKAAFNKMVSLIEPANADGVERGLLYPDLNKLIDAWQTNIGRMPSEREIYAYYTYHQTMAVEGILRDALMRGHWHSTGTMLYRFPLMSVGGEGAGVPNVEGLSMSAAAKKFTRYSDLKDTDKVRLTNTAGDRVIMEKVTGGEKSSSGWFYGRAVKDLPSQNAPAFTVLYQPKSGTHKVFRWQEGAGDAPAIRKGIESGEMKVIQLSKPLAKELTESSGSKEIITHAVVPGFETKPLPPWLMNHNPGVHKIYQPWGYLTQPIVGWTNQGWEYMGQKVLASLDSEAAGSAVSKHYQEIYRLVKSGADANTIDRYLVANRVPENGAYWQRLFHDAYEHKHDLPIRPVPAGRDFNEVYPDSIPEARRLTVNHWDSPYNLEKNLNRSFLQERNPDTRHINLGQSGQSIFSFGNSPKLSPNEALLRAANQVVDQAYLGAHKDQAVQDFARQYADLAKHPVEARNNPWKYFWDMEFRSDSAMSNADKVRLKQAEIVNANLKSFMGLRNEFSKTIDRVAAQIMTSEGRFAKLPGVQTTAQFVLDHELPLLKDPTQWSRNMLYRLSFWFNPGTYIQQATGAINVAALAGAKHGGMGWAGGNLAHGLEWASDEVLRGIAKRSTKWGWNEQDYYEAVKAAHSSGYLRVGGEAIWRDRASDLERIYKNNYGYLQRVASAPFNGGEALTRRTAFFSAAAKWFTEHPGGYEALTPEIVRQEIIPLANQYGQMMTRAFATSAERSPLAIPLWYTTYTRRLLEQYWGGEIPLGAKARLFAMHTALYGLPNASTGVLGGLPFQDEFRKAAFKNGWNVDSIAYRALTQGFLDHAASWISGTDINVGGSLGPNAIRQLSLIPDLAGAILGQGTDKDSAEVFATLLGPLGRGTENVLGGIAPFMRWTVSKITPREDSLNMTADDAISFARMFRAADSGVKALWAIGWHQYLSRRTDAWQGGATTIEGVWMALGFTPQNVIDQNNLQEVAKNFQNNQTKTSDLMVTEYIKAFNAMADGRQERAEAHFANSRWMAAGAFLTEPQIDAAMQRALEQSGKEKTLKVVRDWFNRGSPEEIQARIGAETKGALKDIYKHVEGFPGSKL